MAQSFTTPQGTLSIPGAYPTIAVQANPSGLSTTGVLFLVGEADAGPDYTLESDLSLNFFAPNQLQDVIAKYKTGPLVDAFALASAPANDPDIVGAPSGMVLVKTNPSAKASLAMPKNGGGTYATLFDKSYGQLGNLLSFTVTAKATEVPPTTGSFTYIPPVGTVQYGIRINGGAEQSRTTAANETPAAFQAATTALTGVSCTGGANRGLLSSTHGSVALAVVAGNAVTVTLSGIASWDTTPTAGDTFVIPAASVIAGAGNANVGAYVVTAATTTTVSATKLSDAAKPGAVIGTITAPVAVTAQAVVGANTDVVDYAPITITASSASIIDGVGKSIELNQLTGGTDLLSRVAYQLATTTVVTWVSKTGAPTQLVSATESAITLTNTRQFDSVSETISAGGQVALQIGYTGTTCSVTVGPLTLTTTVVGGSGANLSINLKQYPTLADLATFINSQTGYTCSVGTATLGTFSPLALDEVTTTAGTDFGNQTMRLKVDAVKFFLAVSQQSAVVQVGNPALTAPAGLPALTPVVAGVPTPQFLQGGARGGTTDVVFNASIDALQQVQGNFLVPLFSADAATELQYAYNPTDSTSTYTIANITAYAKTHALTMSTLKRRKNRQAFVAQRSSFVADQNLASNLASYRVSLAMQDVKATTPSGLNQHPPHMLAAMAAGTQAAGFYRAIVHKGINCSGVVQAAGDFNPANDGQLETALQTGLLVAQKASTGGFIWVSDQTTYSKDNNFVYNSIQAVYTADTIALTCAQRMENAFVGQSVADVGASLMLAALESIMSDFLRLKLIAISDDAPKGFKNAKVTISGGTAVVNVEVKLAGAIYFIPINFLVTQVQQSAQS